MAEIDSMQFWMTHLSNRADITRKNYQLYLLKFAEWMGKGPNELVEMQKQSLEHNGDRRENMVLEGKVKEFMNYLEHDAITEKGAVGYGLGSRKLTYAAIQSFFKLNQYPLNMNRGDRPAGDSIGSRIPEKQEILQLVNAAKSRRYRAIILFLKDSGLRLSDVVKLKWEDIQDFGDGFYGFKIITQKRKVKALPFVGPETTEALNQLTRKTGRIFPTSATSVCRTTSQVIKEAGLEKGFSPHGLRKYFNTEMEAARVLKEHRYAMMGKKVSVYDENRQSNLFKIYKEAYDHLRVFGIIKQDKLIQEQAEEIKRLKTQLGPLMEFIDKFENKEVLAQAMLHLGKSLVEEIRKPQDKFVIEFKKVSPEELKKKGKNI